MVMANIDLFDEFTAAAFAKLYEDFPRKTYLDARTISGDSVEDDFGQILDERGAPSKRFEIAKATIEWLIDTGYISSSAMHVWGARDAVLTPSALQVLSATPDSLTPTVTLGEKIVRHVKSGSWELAKEAVKTAFKVGVEVAIRHS